MTDISREMALKILFDVNEKGAYSNIAIDKHLKDSNLRGLDKSFITGLVYGTIQWKLTIDWVIAQFSNIPINKLSPWILNILRLGTYQLLFTDKIPEFAACNESVNLALKYGHTGSAGFVNAVLRNITRQRFNIKYPDRNSMPEKFLSIKYSHPEWMISRWLNFFGEDFTEGLLQSNNEIPDFTVRINTLRISPEVFKKKLEEKDIEYSNGRYIENAVSIKNPSALINSDLNNKGYFYVQDEASMLVPIILDPKPNEIVADVCAAPGGKSTHIAELMGNKGIVISRDIHPHKIELIKKSAEKLGINIIKTELQDAASLSDGQQDCRRNSQQNTCRDRQKDACQDSHRDNRQDSQYVMKADRVLVDAPCSGSGIIRRKPEIKWNRTPEQNEEIKKLQFKILTTSSKYVKIGGTLVYSTCSIEPDENIETVRNFLKSNNEFELTGFDELLPMSLAYAHETAKDGYINLFPNIDKTDGFFIAKMTRKS